MTGASQPGENWDTLPAAMEIRGRNRRRQWNLGATFGVALMTMVAAMALMGPTVYPSDPFAMQGKRFAPPDRRFILGTDYLGRDVLAGIVRGARVSLAVGLASTVIIVTMGVLVGAVAGFYGGPVGEALMRITEFFQILPAFLFAMVLVAIFSPTVTTVIIAIGVTNWAGTARLARAEFLAIKDYDFVVAARALGAADLRIVSRQILPNALPPLVVNGALTVGVSILFEAGLSFLGLSDANTMSWGYMIGSSRVYFRQAWWSVVFPGLAIFVTVLSLSLLGDALNHLLDPQKSLRTA